MYTGHHIVKAIYNWLLLVCPLTITFPIYKDNHKNDNSVLQLQSFHLLKKY